MTSTLQGSSRPLCKLHDVALLDLDGVVYVGPDAVPGAAEALAAARAAGMSLAFVTNNAARPPEAVAEHLRALHIDARADEVITSAQAAARYLAERLPPAARVLVLGTTGLITALEERGLTPVSDAEGHVDAVVQGYSPEMNWRLLAEGAVAINRGVPWIATNVDPTVPSPRGPLPGNGSLVAALRHATRVEPVVTGKPDPTMHRETLLRTGAERPIVVGDRLDTDIEGANEVGCASLLVFSGVTTAADLLCADVKLRPSYLAADVGGLLIAHPEPITGEGGARCGSWRCDRSVTGLRLSSLDVPDHTESASESVPRSDQASDAPGRAALDGESLDAMRALCAAAWLDAPTERTSARSSQARPTVPIVQAADDAAARVLQKLGLESG